MQRDKSQLNIEGRTISVAVAQVDETSSEGSSAGRGHILDRIRQQPALLVDRITSASFLSRGDTATPMKVTLIGVAVNVALKIALFRPLGAPGLALATAAGLWIKVAGVFALARRRGWTAPDARLLATFAATLRSRSRIRAPPA